MNLQSNPSGKSGEFRPSVTAMEGKGFYNKHAAIPAAGGALALPLAYPPSVGRFGLVAQESGATKAQAQTRHQPSKANFTWRPRAAHRSEEVRVCHSPFALGANELWLFSG
jgi:hypothetical protein